ncbi:MAG: aminoglycoside phosphotransferase family protein [Firmicutes bacterium]|nr:aminoglycoside phosphotransferase family protein [Bacillota bacterium]
MSYDVVAMSERVLGYYDLPGKLVEVTPCVNGHINDTYRIAMDTGEEFILQRINGYVFKEPVKVMENIKAITLHVENKEAQGDCNIISFLDSRAGENYVVIDGDYWRVCQYVQDSITYDFVENSQVLVSAGYAFGRFQAVLADFPMEKLHETIPGFHNTRKRLADLFQIVVQDPLGRAREIQEEVAFFMEHRELAGRLDEMLEAGTVPLRVTHNDTKYNNILMHKHTGEPLCVIDLDTVMPGLAMHDFGDAIRFAANTAEEDEPDLSKVGLNMENYRAFTKGFMSACQGFLTPAEIDTMALGAITITIELASRFLADHINGDKYFRIHRENHNLDRARCQIKLAQDMIARCDEMVAVVKEYVSASDVPDEIASGRETEY